MLECIDIAEKYRIMTSKTKKTLEVQVSRGPNVRGPSVPGVQCPWGPNVAGVQVSLGSKCLWGPTVSEPKLSQQRGSK